MKTLHMLHWSDQKKLTDNIALLGHHDSLVIYGTLSNDDIHFVTSKMKNSTHPWFLVKSSSDSVTHHHEIDELGWLSLITKHHNTWAWK